MKRYTSSELTNKRAEVIKEAKANGVIIECRNTNGDVIDSLALVNIETLYDKDEMSYLISDAHYSNRKDNNNE